MGLWGFPGGSEVKASACKAGDPGSIPGSGRSPEEGNGNLLQYSCLENPMDRGAWKVTVHGVAKSQKRLSDFTLTFTKKDVEKKISRINKHNYYTHKIILYSNERVEPLQHKIICLVEFITTENIA